MRKAILLLLLVLCHAGQQVCAQNRADEFMQQADKSLAQKEYIKARYLYLQAYNAFAKQQAYDKAVKCGIGASALYHRENYYKEAFDVLSQAKTLVAKGEQQTGKSMPMLHYSIAKERMRIYIKLQNSARAKAQLAELEQQAKAAASDSLTNDLLYAQASYHYTFGQTAQGDAAIGRLIGRYQSQGDYGKADQCYKELIATARKSGNASVLAHAYERYMAWNDSAQALAAQSRYDSLQQQYADSQAAVAQRDQSIATKQYVIVGLCVLAAVLAAALVLGAIVLLRFIVLTRRQKKLIDTANEHNELKSRFIRNISAQMEPTLATLPPQEAGVQALRTFAAHIQQLAELESTLHEPYEMQEKNIATFCDSLAAQAQNWVKPDVTLSVNAPKLTAKIAPEALEQLLLHLLHGAATHTPEGGKIWLDFKKRGAHTHQFVVSDTGCGIADEKREDLFKPFTEVKDLTQGDGLGLPICALMATKMNGSLTLDTSYTKGTRFVLELHV